MTTSISLYLVFTSRQGNVPKIFTVNFNFFADGAFDFNLVADFYVVADVRAVDEDFTDAGVPAELCGFVCGVKASTATGRFGFVVVVYRFPVVELNALVVSGHGEASGGFHGGGGAERGA